MPTKVAIILIGIVGAIVAIIVLAKPPALSEQNPADVNSQQAATQQSQTAAAGQDSQDKDGAAQTRSANSQPTSAEENPPANAFNARESDARAIELADLTMRKMGGREAWDNVRYVTWYFTPSERRYIWDRVRNIVRLEHVTADPEDETKAAAGVLVFDLLKLTGRYWINGEEVEEQGRIAGMCQTGKNTWINDSYWLFMPYKLKDSHVTLTYVGERAMKNDKMAEVIELAFDGVGLTPNNLYNVYISKETGLVEQWDFYGSQDDQVPRFQLPWKDWRRHGPILLSGDREQLFLSDIAVFEDLPDFVWEDGFPLNMRDLRAFIAKPVDPTDPRYLPGPIGQDS